MERKITKIKSVQRLSDGTIITLGKNQIYCETEKSYEVWGKDELGLDRRVIAIRKRNAGFISE